MTSSTVASTVPPSTPQVCRFLWATVLANRVGSGTVIALPFYLTDVHQLAVAATGILVGLVGIGGVVGAVAGGMLADRHGRRQTLLLCYSAILAALSLLVFAPTLPFVVLAIFVVGAGHQMAEPALVASIIDIVPEAQRPRILNFHLWLYNVGGVGAALLAGCLAGTSFFVLFLVDAAFMAAALALTWLRVPATMAPSRRPGLFEGVATVSRDRVFLAFIGLSFLCALADTQAATVLPMFMHERGLSAASYGTVAAFSLAIIVLGQLFVPRLVGGARKGRVLAAGTLLLGTGMVLIAPAGGSLLGYLVAALVWTMGNMLAAPPNATVVVELAPSRLRAGYQAMFYLIFPAAKFVGPALGGWSLQWLGNGHWLAVGAVAVFAASGHLLAATTRAKTGRSSVRMPDGNRVA